MSTDLTIAAITIVVFLAGFACGRLDRGIRRIRPLSAEDILTMIREPNGAERYRAGGLI